LMDLLYNISKYGAIESVASFNTLHGIKSDPVDSHIQKGG
jgi:hypothetical protein